MNSICHFFEMMEMRQPFCLVRFNDGEVTGMMSPASIVARGDQRVGMSLSGALSEALSYNGQRYFVGLPCPDCFPEHYSFVVRNFQVDERRRTMAVVFTNDNWPKAWREILKNVGERPLKVVCGEDQNWESMERGFNLNLETFKIPSRNSWAHRMSVLELYRDFPAGSVVLLSCGPLSRVLAHRWWKERQDITILDVGSTFDPWTRNVWHNCHKWKNGMNQGNYCKECNQKGQKRV